MNKKEIVKVHFTVFFKEKWNQIKQFYSKQKNIWI